MASSRFDSSSDEEAESPPTDTQPLRIDWVDLSIIGYPNSVGISQMPGCKFKNNWRNLKNDLETMTNAGIQSVYVLLTTGELRKYRASQLLDEYNSSGINVHHYPFPDGTVPTVDIVVNFIYDLKEDLGNQRKTLIHCYGGLGRSCFLVACFMLEMDESLSPDRVIDIFRSIRGAGAIQTVKQYNFIQDFRKLREIYDQSPPDEARSLSR
uniref:protein-tyrosine-phosphatase n=1 Tax=Strigamia maritima TaxID=126957 RepID=T1JGM7_STRMM